MHNSVPGNESSEIRARRLIGPAMLLYLSRLTAKMVLRTLGRTIAYPNGLHRFFSEALSNE